MIAIFGSLRETTNWSAFVRSSEREGKRKLLLFSTIPVNLRRLHLGRICLTLPLFLEMSDWSNSSKAHMARNKTRNTSSWPLHKNRMTSLGPFFITTKRWRMKEGWIGRVGGGRCGHGLPAGLERIIINLYVRRGPSNLNYKWRKRGIYICQWTLIKDLEIRYSSLARSVVSLDKELCSTRRHTAGCNSAMD